jgi:hypothetical protein
MEDKRVWAYGMRGKYGARGGVHRKERGHLEYLSVFVRIILKWFLKRNSMGGFGRDSSGSGHTQVTGS